MPCRKAIEPSSASRACAIHASIVAASARPVAIAGAAASVVLPIPCATRVRSKMLTTPSPLISSGESEGHAFPQLPCDENQIQNIDNLRHDSHLPVSSRSSTVMRISSGPAGMTFPSDQSRTGNSASAKPVSPSDFALKLT